MSTRRIASRSRRPKRRAAALPPLPRPLIPAEVAHQTRYTGRPWFRPDADEAPLRPEDLTRAARARLRYRAWRRYQRVRRRGFRNTQDRFWIAKELALSLHGAPRQTIAFWRWRLHWAIRHAEDTVDALRKLEALVLAHEPEADAWLRRQLAELAPRRGA